MSESDDVKQARARVEAARSALDSDIATLTDRLPAAATLVQTGAAGGGGLAAIGVLLKVLQSQMSKRSEAKAITRETEIQARAIATAIATQREAERQAAEDAAAQAAARAAKEKAKADAAAAKAAAKAEKAAAKASASDAAASDDGAPWGLLLLVAAIVAAIVAYVTSQDDEDIWLTE